MTTVQEAMEEKGLSTKEITWENEVDVNQQSHIWHDGHVCSITHEGVMFAIMADGEINFSLHQYNPIDQPLIDWNNQREHLDMKYELGGYIDTDEDLTKAMNLDHPKYELQIDTSNQYECVIVINEMYVDSFELESELLIDAIKEVQNNIVRLSEQAMAKFS